MSDENVVRGRLPMFHLGQDSSLQLHVEFFAGASIEKVCKEMCSLAARMQVVVMGKFNGVTLMAIPGGDPEILRATRIRLASYWESELASKHTYKLASSHPRDNPAPTSTDLDHRE